VSGFLDLLHPWIFGFFSTLGSLALCVDVCCGSYKVGLAAAVAGQPQCPRLWHSSTPNARSLSHSPSAPTPSFTQSPYPPRSLVRDEQTHPHRPRLVVSHSTCPALSSSPPANSFVIGPAVINTHTSYGSSVFSWVAWHADRCLSSGGAGENELRA